MDALARLAPVARPLLRDVDNALATLGAPPEHSVWALLRQTGTTPADAVAFFVDLDPNRLRVAGQALRLRALAYDAATVPATVPWEGSAAHQYAVQAVSLGRFLHGDEAETLASRLRATGSYVDSVADWCQHSRDQVARTLAQVLTSSQAVAVRSVPALGRGLGDLMRAADPGGGLARAVTAAADIGAAVLGVAEDAVVAGRNLHRTATPALAELMYQPPAQSDPARDDGTIRLQHW
jgi:hypothetical protein